jgi:hypothetical protein
MDWKKNRVLIGSVALVGLAVALFFVAKGRDDEPADAESEEEVTGLLPEVDSEALTELEIRRPEEEPIIVTKGEDGWVLTAPVQAPADQGVVDTALEKIGELDALRVAATNPENHERMEVSEDKGVRVIARADGDEVIDLWIGSFNRGNTFVRVEGDDRVIAVAGSIKFAFNKELKDWRNRRVVDVAPGDVTDIAFQNENGSWRFERGEDDEWQQAEGAAEIERFGASKVQSIVASLARMRATSFGDDATAETAGLGEGAAVVTMTVTTTTGDDEEGEEGAGEEESAEETSSAVTEQIVLRLGSDVGGESSEAYLVREGNDTIFVVSSFLAEKIRVNVESFQNPEPGEEGEEAEAPPPPMPGGVGGPGGGQIPPEVMQQIQQQLQKQGAH